MPPSASSKEDLLPHAHTKNGLGLSPLLDTILQGLVIDLQSRDGIFLWDGVTYKPQAAEKAWVSGWSDDIRTMVAAP